MAEKQSIHRMDLENHTIREELSQSRYGQMFGFILGILGLASAVALALYDHEVVAGIIGGATLVSLVTVFVVGKKAQAEDLESKK